MMVDMKDFAVDDEPAASVTAASRVFGTPELLEKILGHLDVVEIFRFQRVNTTFNNIFTIAPHLLRTMGVQATLQGGAPSDHAEEFGPLVVGLKKRELLIRPFEFRGVTTEPGSGEQTLSFFQHVDIAKYAKDHGTVMGRAGKSGKDYDSSHTWATVAVATSSFKIEMVTQYPSGAGHKHEFHMPSEVTTMRYLFKILEATRDHSIVHYEKTMKEQREERMEEEYKKFVKRTEDAFEALLKLQKPEGKALWEKIRQALFG